MIGDIVGRPGIEIVCQHAQNLKTALELDFLIANAENAEDGSGLTKAIYKRLKQAGVDGFTLGDHIYRKREIISVLETENDIVRPANFPPEAPGKKIAYLENKAGRRLGLISLIGRVFMKPVDCPFHAIDDLLKSDLAPVDGILVDLHAEATSDKQLIGRYLDGRVSAVLGTHTHVPTADEQILPKGTAFQCDIGMTGPHDGILGRDYNQVIETTYSFKPTLFHVATGDVRINGAIIEIDPQTKCATSIKRAYWTTAMLEAKQFQPK